MHFHEIWIMSSLLFCEMGLPVAQGTYRFFPPDVHTPVCLSSRCIHFRVWELILASINQKYCIWNMHTNFITQLSSLLFSYGRILVCKHCANPNPVEPSNICLTMYQKVDISFNTMRLGCVYWSLQKIIQVYVRRIMEHRDDHQVPKILV